MKKVTLPGTAESISLIGQGTWHLELEDRNAAKRALQAGLDAGMTHVDTAEAYGNGEVERLVGEALAERRDEVVLASKVLPENATREGTARACEDSLRRLKTDRLDLYLLHWPGPHPMAETVAAFETLREQGKILAWGVSNFDDRELAEVLEIAGTDKVACDQVLYHLEERRIEHALLPFCRDNGIPVVAYSPFGSGDFPAPESDGGRVLADVAKAHDADPHQIALAFLVDGPGIAAIPRTGDAEHARDNAAAAAITLSAEERQSIDRAFPAGPRRTGVPTI